MGAGDKQAPFDPSYEPILDDVIGKMFSPGCVRLCPHPSVINRYGTGGKANVSVYTCRKCRYVVKHEMFGGVSCGYTQL